MTEELHDGLVAVNARVDRLFLAMLTVGGDLPAMHVQLGGSSRPICRGWPCVRKSRRGRSGGACVRAGGVEQGYSSPAAIQGPLRGSQRGLNPPIQPETRDFRRSRLSPAPRLGGRT